MNKSKKFLIVTCIFIIDMFASMIIVSAVDNSYTRPLYTRKEIDEGALDSLMNQGKVTFNSIYDKDARFYDETNFVGARLDDGDDGKDNEWEHLEITAKDGETYVVRAFVHNNTISDEENWKKDGRGVAHNTKVSFNIPQTSASEIKVHGIINASNAVPQEVFDSVVFKAEDGKKFHLEYVYDSALLENNGIGTGKGVALSNDIVKAKSGGTLIGYDALNGEFPGCYQFFSFVTIKVKVVYDSVNNFALNNTVRLAGTTGKNWRDNLDVEIGDEVEYQLFYTNTSEQNQYNVTLIDKLPVNMEYVKGSTRLWNADMDGYTHNEDTITTEGVNIGNYGPGANAYVRFRAKVVDKNLTRGSNMLVNWAKGTVNYGTEGEMVLQDFANVTLQKDGWLDIIERVILRLLVISFIFSIILRCILKYMKK